MSTPISLDNQEFWAPPITGLATPRHIRSSQPLTGQSQGATLPALHPRTSPSHDAVISRDEESDSNNNDDVRDDESDMANRLPSIVEILSNVNGLGRGYFDTTVSPAILPERIHCSSVESQRSLVISQPGASASVCSPRAVLSPELAAARPFTAALTSPTATPCSENRQPCNGEETRSGKSDHSPVVYGDTNSPEPEATPDATLDTAVHTALGPDRHEKDLDEQENDPQSDSVACAMADAATSVAHKADTETMKAGVQVREDLPPAYTRGGASIQESIQQPMTFTSEVRSTRRRRQTGITHSVSTTSDGEVPPNKRRKVTASVGLRRGAQLSSVRKPRTRPSDQEIAHRHTNTSVLDRDHTENHTDASYQEWPLPDAVLQQTYVDGQATLQLRFTWATVCTSHMASDVRSGPQQPILSNPRQDCGAWTRMSKPHLVNRNTDRTDSSNASEENDIYAVARLLARWKRGTYLLEWADGTTSWEPKKNILDQEMLNDFEATYRGFNAGIDVLASRVIKGRQQWRLHWHGRPTSEDCWVDERLMDHTRVEEAQALARDT